VITVLAQEGENPFWERRDRGGPYLNPPGPETRQQKTQKRKGKGTPKQKGKDGKKHPLDLLTGDKPNGKKGSTHQPKETKNLRVF